MGKFEVLKYLEDVRARGDDSFFSYCEIFKGMKYENYELSYQSVWRSVLSLARDDMLDIAWEGSALRRNPRFRSREDTHKKSFSPKKEDNNKVTESQKSILVEEKW